MGRRADGSARARQTALAVRLIAISGSLRRGSYNGKLVEAAARELPRGVDFELFGGLEDVLTTARTPTSSPRTRPSAGCPWLSARQTPSSFRLRSTTPRCRARSRTRSTGPRGLSRQLPARDAGGCARRQHEPLRRRLGPGRAALGHRGPSPPMRLPDADDDEPPFVLGTGLGERFAAAVIARRPALRREAARQALATRLARC
jgi:hypothetical protein